MFTARYGVPSSGLYTARRTLVLPVKSNCTTSLLMVMRDSEYQIVRYVQTPSLLTPIARTLFSLTVSETADPPGPAITHALSLLAAKNSMVDGPSNERWDSESLLHPRYFSCTTNCSSDKKSIHVVDSDEIGVSWCLIVPSHNDAPRKRGIQREVAGAPTTEVANTGQRITSASTLL